MIKGKKKNVMKDDTTGAEVEFASVNPRTGEPVDIGVLEEAGIAFDPTTTHLDLTKEEKRRTTALMMAIQAYSHLIIKDADYLRESHAQEHRGGPVIQPATMDAMLVGAIQFDAFIAGKLTLQRAPIGGGGIQSEKADESANPTNAVDPVA